MISHQKLERLSQVLRDEGTPSPWTIGNHRTLGYPIVTSEGYGDVTGVVFLRQDIEHIVSFDPHTAKQLVREVKTQRYALMGVALLGAFFSGLLIGTKR